MQTSEARIAELPVGLPHSIASACKEIHGHISQLLQGKELSMQLLEKLQANDVEIDSVQEEFEDDIRVTEQDSLNPSGDIKDDEGAEN